MASSDEEIRLALEDVLRLHGIEFEDKDLSSEEKEERNHDYSDIIGRTQQKIDELNEKAEAIYEKTGMTHDQLEAYAANPSNFSPEQWEVLQKVRDACEKYKREARAKIPDTQFEKKIEKTKRKKEIHRFAKKKNWIPL